MKLFILILLYSGIPEDLNIEKITIKDNKELLPTKIDQKMMKKILKKYSPEFLNLENTDELDYELIKHTDEEKINEILLDNFELEDEYEEFYHSVNVPENEKRYTLDTQLNDYMDNILNNLKSEEKMKLFINNINLELNRYKELRELYSEFDENNNPKMVNEKGEFYKPLKEIIT